MPTPLPRRPRELAVRVQKDGTRNMAGIIRVTTVRSRHPPPNIQYHRRAVRPEESTCQFRGRDQWVHRYHPDYRSEQRQQPGTATTAWWLWPETPTTIMDGG